MKFGSISPPSTRPRCAPWLAGPRRSGSNLCGSVSTSSFPLTKSPKPTAGTSNRIPDSSSRGLPSASRGCHRAGAPRLMVAVVMPMHSPFNLARSIATVDVLSIRPCVGGSGARHDQGRVRRRRPGILQSWRSNERDDSTTGSALHRGAPGIPRQVLRHCTFGIRAQAGPAPRPLAPPHRRVQSGGAERAVELGDGWFGTMPSPERGTVAIADLQRRRADLGRPPLEITLLTGWAHGYDSNLVEGYEEAGVSPLVVKPWSSSRHALEGIERFAVEAGVG